MWIYVITFVGLGAVPLFLAGFGAHLAAVPPANDTAKLRAKLIAWGVALFGVILIGVQQVVIYRSDKRHDEIAVKRDADDNAFRTATSSTLKIIGDRLVTALGTLDPSARQEQIASALSDVLHASAPIQTSQAPSANEWKVPLRQARIDVENGLITRMAGAGEIASQISQDPKKNVAALRTLTLKTLMPDDLSARILGFLDSEETLERSTQVHEKEALHDLETGANLVRDLAEKPTSLEEVVMTNVLLYSDEGLTKQRPDCVGVILQNRYGGIATGSPMIYLTAKLSYYRTGTFVSWQWDFSKHWDKTWYRDPITNQVRVAADASAGFAGVDINELKVK